MPASCGEKMAPAPSAAQLAFDDSVPALQKVHKVSFLIK